MSCSAQSAAPPERLIVAFRGGVYELTEAINLCRRFEGSLVDRQRDVLIIEVGAPPAVIDELLARLPRRGVTHLWRSGGHSLGAEAPARGEPAIFAASKP